MISLGNVTFQYAGCEEGVRNIDLTIRDGECVVSVSYTHLTLPTKLEV